MPSTSEEHRARWPGWDVEAIEWLEDRGYRQSPDSWEWFKPEIPGFEPSEKDLDAIDFLIMEFDWGGLRP